MAKNKKQSFSLQKNNKSPLVLGAVFVGIIILAALGYFIFNMNQNNNQLTGSNNDPYINLEPPTESDKAEADQNKERLSQTKEEDESEIPSSNEPQKKSVKPTITEATRNSVKGYITSIFEEGGTCTATFTKNGQSLTKTSSGFQNASYTQCAPIEMADDFLSPGKWEVKLSYSSTASSGESDVHNIE